MVHLFSAANLVKFSQKVILKCKKIPIFPFSTAKTSKLDIIFQGYHSTFIHAWRRCTRETAWLTLEYLSSNKHVCRFLFSVFVTLLIEKKKEEVSRPIVVHYWNRIRKERKWLKSMEIHISCISLLHPPNPHPPPPHPSIPSHFSMQNIYKVESRVQSPKSRVQSPESRVQSPESRVQSPESRV